MNSETTDPRILEFRKERRREDEAISVSDLRTLSEGEKKTVLLVGGLLKKKMYRVARLVLKAHLRMNGWRVQIDRDREVAQGIRYFEESLNVGKYTRPRGDRKAIILWQGLSPLEQIMEIVHEYFEGETHWRTTEVNNTVDDLIARVDQIDLAQRWLATNIVGDDVYANTFIEHCRARARQHEDEEGRLQTIRAFL